MSSISAQQSKSLVDAPGLQSLLDAAAALMENQSERRVANSKRQMDEEADVDQDVTHLKKRAAVSKSTAKKTKVTADAEISESNDAAQETGESDQASSAPPTVRFSKDRYSSLPRKRKRNESLRSHNKLPLSKQKSSRLKSQYVLLIDSGLRNRAACPRCGQRLSIRMDTSTWPQAIAQKVLMRAN
jgi:hypothetical protein